MKNQMYVLGEYKNYEQHHDVMGQYIPILPSRNMYHMKPHSPSEVKN